MWKYLVIAWLVLTYCITAAKAGERVYRIGFDVNYPPHEFLDEKGEPTGFDIDIAKAVMETLGEKYTLVGGTWNEITQKLNNGQIDMIAGMYLNPGRDSLYDFSTAYLIVFHSIFFSQTSRIKNMSELETEKNPVAIIQKNQYLINFLKGKNTSIIFNFGLNAQHCLQLLSSGAGDIAIVPETVGKYFIKEYNYRNIESSTINIIPREYGFAVKSGDTALVKKLNRGLSHILSSGEYKKINNNWFPHAESSKWQKILLNVAFVLLILLGLALLVYFTWNRQLKKVVARKTEELEEELKKRKQIEAELIKAREKAEESDRLKSAFLSNMSHELRTPMNAIIGFSELLADPDTSPEEKKDYYELVNVNANILLNLINDIIDISKIEAGQMEIQREPVRVNSLLSSLYENFMQELKVRKKSDISLELVMPESEDFYVLADEIRLSQVITNLVVNAIKFTREGFIRYGYILEKGKQEVNFFVKDTGPGISPEKQQIIFERFRQAEEGLNRRYEGAGLGLFICRNLVTLMGGKIWLESELGKGSTFWFSLPIPQEIGH
ncbi:MAG: transporter substrate-binding domain-containing protein [Bacteroidales bacterium]